MVRLYSKREVLDKVAVLESCSVEQDGQTAPFFAALKTAVEGYYNALPSRLTRPVRDVVKYIFNDISRRTTKHRNEYGDDDYPTDFPKGYDDVRACLYDFAPIVNADGAAVYAAFVYETPAAGAGAAPPAPVPEENPVLDGWTAAVTAAAQKDADAVSALAVWCRDGEGNADIIDLFEDRGATTEQKSTAEMAAEIYEKRGIREIIEMFGLRVHIPACLKEGD